VLLRPEGSPSALQFKEISRTEIVIAVTRSGVVRNKGSVQSALSVEVFKEFNMSITPNSLSAVSESLLSRHANGALADGGSVADRPLLAGVAGRRSVITYLDNVKTTALDSRSERIKCIKWQSVLIWFRILRAHYRWPLFEAIRFALWLSR
jgi:hypothetical protein